MLVKSICRSILRPRPFYLRPLRCVHTGEIDFSYSLFFFFLGTSFIHANASKASDSTLSPALLTRARLLAAEHAKLSDRLGESFDAKTAKRAGELAPIANVLNEWVNTNDVCALETITGSHTDWSSLVYRRAQISPG